MTKSQQNHFSPRFANSYWADNGHYICWESRSDQCAVVSLSKGHKQWGRKRGLYARRVESSLAQDLETPIAPIYQRFTECSEPELAERRKWAQFIRSQIVRTPSFIRYERAVLHHDEITVGAERTRVGCEACSDLIEVVGRNWLVLRVHTDDYFIRTDNPVLCTGFLNDPTTVIYYPLTPSLCFVCASMPTPWNPEQIASAPEPVRGVLLEKGDAHMLNFYFAKCADESLVVRPSDAGPIAESMFTDVLGVYPQPPFDLHRPNRDQMDAARESIRMIMTIVDRVEYPIFDVHDIAPFYAANPKPAGNESMS